MYGKNAKTILNDGTEPFLDDDFKNSYQNEQADGKKNFMMLWLHAYRYTIPAFMGNDAVNEDEKPLKVKTAKPKWTDPEWKFVQW
jgi:hypothetical protein